MICHWYFLLLCVISHRTDWEDNCMLVCPVCLCLLLLGSARFHGGICWNNIPVVLERSALGMIHLATRRFLVSMIWWRRDFAHPTPRLFIRAIFTFCCNSAHSSHNFCRQMPALNLYVLWTLWGSVWIGAVCKRMRSLQKNVPNRCISS